ncbi:universal stress protein [Streptomyces sp. SP17BM10]|uniref:universal stress protein n=1 Tax=Streptomyces sp. SP17BM10 TaxID=3002530 RepID=UPI002E77561F|nr:universal stress protein [Streptomyces sp. SP17BM10]MEE1786706.1 universal stress protein [Streptomyces sp. SP17BM10]
MSHNVVVGVDGSEPSAAAAEWAAQEAHRTGSALRLVHVAGTEADALARELDGVGGVPQPVAAIRDRVAAAVPGLDSSCEVLPGKPAYALAAAGHGARLLVLGSRGLGGFTGLLVGSVGLRTAAHADCPVVLVRAGADGRGGSPGDVVVGVEGDRPCDAVLGFAFRHAADTGAVLRAVESRHPSHGPYVTDAPLDDREITESLRTAEEVRLRDALARWREKYPEVRTQVDVCAWNAGRALVEASRSASLVVLGRRAPRHPLAAPRLGPVAHAVLHHAHSPVAIVPHD